MATMLVSWPPPFFSLYTHIYILAKPNSVDKTEPDGNDHKNGQTTNLESIQDATWMRQYTAKKYSVLHFNLNQLSFLLHKIYKVLKA